MIFFSKGKKEKEEKMDYRVRRKNAGLTPYACSKNMGIEYNKWLEVEKGIRPLEKNYVDKFQETILNAKSIMLEHSIKVAKIKNIIKTGELKQFIYDNGFTRRAIGDALQCSASLISHAMNGDFDIASEDTIERIYDFVTEPMNKPIIRATGVYAPRITKNLKNTILPKGKVLKVSSFRYGGTGRGNNVRLSTEQLNWWNSIELVELLEQEKITYIELAKSIGLAPTSIYNIILGKRRASNKTIKMIYDYFHNNYTETKETNINKSLKSKKELDTWYSTFNFKKALLEKETTIRAISDATGYATATLYNLKNGHKSASQELKKTLYDYFNEPNVEELTKSSEVNKVEIDNVTTVNENNKDIESVEPIESKNSIEVVNDTMLRQQLGQLIEENASLKRQIETYVKILERLL